MPARASTGRSSPSDRSASVISQLVGGIWVGYALIAAAFAVTYAPPSIRVVISSSGLPNGRSSTDVAPSNGLSSDVPNRSNAASSALRGTAVQYTLATRQAGP